MNQFSIRDIEMLSGIKAHTLRIWEQRHGFNFCKRKESQHRYYDNDDLKQILRISFLYHHGYKISKIARLSAEQITELTPADVRENEEGPAIDSLIRSSIIYDEEAFSEVLEKAISKLGFEAALLKVMYPFLEKIGMLWMTDRVIPAQEHFSSYLIQNKIFRLTEELVSTSTDSAAVLIFAPAGELHEIPLVVARYVFKKHGILTYYLGVNIDLPEVAYFCRHKRITHLYFHLITNFQFFEPAAYLQKLLTLIPDVGIVASGPVMNTVREVPEKVKILNSLGEVLRVQNILEM